MGRGSRAMGRGSRATGHGSRAMGHGSRAMGHGSRAMGRGSRAMGHGARATVHGNDARSASVYVDRQFLRGEDRMFAGSCLVWFAFLLAPQEAPPKPPPWDLKLGFS